MMQCARPCKSSGGCWCGQHQKRNPSRSSRHPSEPGRPRPRRRLRRVMQRSKNLLRTARLVDEPARSHTHSEPKTNKSRFPTLPVFDWLPFPSPDMIRTTLQTGRSCLNQIIMNLRGSAGSVMSAVWRKRVGSKAAKARRILLVRHPRAPKLQPDRCEMPHPRQLMQFRHPWHFSPQMNCCGGLNR